MKTNQLIENHLKKKGFLINGWVKGIFSEYDCLVKKREKKFASFSNT